MFRKWFPFGKIYAFIEELRFALLKKIASPSLVIVFEFNYQCVTAEHIVHIQFYASNVPSKPYNERIPIMLLFTDWPSKLWHPAAMTRVLTHFSHSLFLILHGPYTI